jgi:hypothetical protein
MVKDDKGENTLWCMAWMAIYGDRRAHLVDLLASKDCKVDVDDDKTIFGLAKTGSFLMPSNLGKLIKKGMELGDADDKVFGRELKPSTDQEPSDHQRTVLLIDLHVMNTP